MIAFFMLLVSLLLYTFFLLFATLILSLNAIKLKKKYGIDSILLFMLLYLLNFLTDYACFPIFPYYLLQISHTILLVIIISSCSSLQIIGLTGGIACGKSTATSLIKATYSLEVIDCDLLSRVIVQPGKPAYDQIIKAFGRTVLMSEEKSSEIDRTKLGELIFANNGLRRKLTRITSYYIFLEIIKELYRVFFVEKRKEVLLDAPTLFESKYLEFLCYPILLVYVTEEKIQVQRMKERNGYDEEHARSRIRSQMAISYKLKKSDVLLNNEGSVEELKSNIMKSLPLYLV